MAFGRSRREERRVEKAEEPSPAAAAVAPTKPSRAIARRRAATPTRSRCSRGILAISERTVNFHVTNIKRKLGATNRGQALAIAARLGLLRCA
jgi:Bacterial regulatory proteins, luxR family